MYAEERKLKWKKEAAGCYKTTCGTYWVTDNYTEALYPTPHGRAWNLYCKNRHGFIDEIVDTFGAKRQAQDAAENLNRIWWDWQEVAKEDPEEFEKYTQLWTKNINRNKGHWDK